MLSKLEHVNRRVTNALAVFAGAMFLGIALFTFVDVIARYVFKSPIIGTLEIIQLVLPWAVSLSFAYGLIEGIHPRVVLLTRRLPARFQRGLNIYLNLAGFLLFALLTWGMWLHFWSSWKVKEIMFAALMTLPVWVAKLALPIGTLLIGVTYLVYFIRAVSRKGEP